jgi:hypothetical protein
MSRGPGRIEREIERLFAEQPSRTFSTDDIAKAVYPGLAEIEKRHRVAVLRAADNVAARQHWEKRQCERFGWGNRWPGQTRETLKGRGTVYVNRLDAWSQTLGWLRIDSADGDQTEEEWDARPGQGGDRHQWIVPGGPAWLEVEHYKSKIAGTAPAPELQALIDKHESGREAFWRAFPGKKASAAEIERRDRRVIANLNASLCSCCGRSISPNEPVARVLFHDSPGFAGGSRSIIELQCLECCGAKIENFYSSSCLSCQRLVYQRPRLGRFRTFCCTLHRRRYYRPG